MNLFDMPEGVPSLIKIGMEKVILPEVFHLYSEIKK